MKYLRMFEAATGLFPKRIKVTLVDWATGKKLGSYKVPAKLLPESFNRPTTVEINDIDWRVLQANPVLAEDFLFTKKLTLKVLETSNFKQDLLKFDLPTICCIMPAIEPESLYNDFTSELEDNDWRQIEFFPLKCLAQVENSIQIIDTILNNQSNPLLGYESQFCRDGHILTDLSIPLDSFCALLNNPVYGNISLGGKEFAQNGFAIRSDSHVFYGILTNGNITTLCLKQFDYVDDELMNILTNFELSLVDWCNVTHISAEPGEEPKSEFIEI